VRHARRVVCEVLAVGRGGPLALSDGRLGDRTMNPDLGARAISGEEKAAFPTESPQAFQIIDLEGQVHRIPFHRVREVYRDSQRIWHRGEEPAYS
jgi:hypothetical protein